MAVVSRVTTIQQGAASGTRNYIATATVQDTAAGSSVTVTYTTGTTGLTPPIAPGAANVTFKTDSGTTVGASWTAPSNGASTTFYFTSDGTSGGSARAGTIEIVLNVVSNNAGQTYNITSDGSTNTPQTGFSTQQLDRGYIRGTTTVTTTLNQASFAYGNTVTATTTLGATPFNSKTVNVAFSPITSTASASSSTTAFTTSLGTCDNRFAASSNTLTTATTVPNSTFTGIPWTSSTSTTEASATVDPRLTFTHLHQDNDNVYGTPPSSKDVGVQRLSSNLAFLASRASNASGAGVNGLQWNVILYDAGQLIGTPASPVKSRSVTATTQGGQAGWSDALLVWDNSLPGGNWTKTCTITTSGATGLESNNTTTYQLIASNPNLRILTGAGPATNALDARHMSPGVPMLAGIVVFNIKTMQTVALDSSPTPSVALGRFNLSLGRAEFLDSDGTWKATNGANVYYWPCTQSAGDSNAWTVSWANTSTWGVADIFVVGSAYVSGVPVNDFMKEIFVNGINNHDKYAFDGPGFVGFPSR